MGDEEWFEERYIGNRRFRRMADGRVVEILGDGTPIEDFLIEGREFDSWEADFESITGAFETQPAPVEPEATQPTPPPEAEKPVEAPREKTTEEKIREYMLKKHGVGGDERLRALKETYSGVYSGSMREVMDDSPKGTPLGMRHGLGGLHGIRRKSRLFNRRQDPLKKMLEDRKPTTYREHMEKVLKSRKGSDSGGLGSSSMQGSRGLSRFSRMRKSKSKRSR
jgi:hypothetical protein